ncbi:TNF receptor-associated factor 2-like [Hyposmocoma kahamanoa]|uniref:TNF receptor-associated factor 2-like n=1 Tax=Hyposmocoma kahamanoa TaxID=1477025 RepID=UPI000E6D7D17|nr:TNF receptor-associated factor 2-like [Hyposmocoma kahamanoa]
MDRNRSKDASEGIAPMGITALNETVLSNQPESRYECPVCLNWLRDPVITTCGHKFCKSCITSWLQNSGHCPIDNINLSMKVDIFPDNYTKREIQEQRMSCPFASKGKFISCNVYVLHTGVDSGSFVIEKMTKDFVIVSPCDVKFSNYNLTLYGLNNFPFATIN